MSREPRIPGLRRLLRPRAPDETVERDIEDEIRFHIESRTEELMGEGVEAGEARRRAEREYGDVDESRRELADVDRRYRGGERRSQWWEALVLDLRYAFRGIRRSPGLTTVVVITLTLGIGANAVMFGVVDRLLLRPPPHVADPERIVRILIREREAGAPTTERRAQPVTGYPLVTALRENVPSLARTSGISRSAVTVGRGVDAARAWVSAVDGDFFPILGVRPLLGRFFTPEESAIPMGERVAVLGHGFWRRHFGGDDHVLGATVEVDGEPFTVIGVAPPGFTGIDLDPVDAWVPLSSVAARAHGEHWPTWPHSWWLRVVGQLAPGASAAGVEAEATVAFRNALREWEQPWRDSLGAIVTGPVIAARGPEDTPLHARVSVWLLGVSAVVLLIACANIANMLIARALRRRREMAVRLALGIGHARLTRQLVTETLLLATLASAVAVLLTQWGGAFLRSVLLPGVAWDDGLLDPRVLVFTALVALLTGVIAGIAPAFQAARTDVAGSLKAGGGAGAGRRSRLRTGLLITQTALSVVLLVGAALFVRSLHNLRSLDVGIDLQRVLLVQMNLSRAGYEAPRIRALYGMARERVAAHPGVERATIVAASVPMQMAHGGGIEIPGRDSLPRLPGGGPYESAIDADYFRTLGARIIRGRDFTETDVSLGARVMIVNATLAEHYWPNEDPVGQCVYTRDARACTEIVGVVQDLLLFRMVGDPRALIFVPVTHPMLAQARPSGLLVRVGDAGARVAGAVRSMVQGLDPNMPYVNVRSYGELVAPELAPWRLGATMFSVFGGLALLIAAVGLYSVIAYVTSERTHEIGVRMALGADRLDVVRLVLFGALGVVGVGLAIGAAASLAAGRWVEPLLFETSPRDPLIFVAVAAVLALAATAASLIPAWRASRVDPAVALRAE